MNIFYTSSCPIESARVLDNKRVLKMAIESTQLLCTSIWSRGACTRGFELYKPTHANHPCATWIRVGTSANNFTWLWEHARALVHEFDKFARDPSNSLVKLRPILDHDIPLIVDSNPEDFDFSIPFSEPPNCSGLTQDSDPKDLTTKYKLCLIRKWSTDIQPPVWSGDGRRPPDWYSNT